MKSQTNGRCLALSGVERIALKGNSIDRNEESTELVIGAVTSVWSSLVEKAQVLSSECG